MPEFITPLPVDPGDRVAIIAPSSGGVREALHVFELGLQRLRERFDLEPVVYPTARQGTGFLVAHPRACATDIHTAFHDPEITEFSKVTKNVSAISISCLTTLRR